MKPAMAILVCGLAVGLAAQNPSIIQDTRATMNGVHDNAAAASGRALGIREKAPSAAKAAPAPVKAGGGAAVPTQTSAPVVVKKGASKASAGKPVRVAAGQANAQAKPASAETPKEAKPATQTVAGNSAGTTEASDKAPGEEGAEPENKWNSTNKRDPFISPVVSHASGSGCNTGKKCLEIGTINLRGVVHAENGFIAVVSNGLNKAYFLRENDPVFNGYVVKITGDSIVFQETLQDRLGKTFTREVVKKITAPAV